MIQYPERQRILFPISQQVVICSDNLLDLTRKHESPLSATFYSHNSFIHGRENKLTNMHVYTYLKNVNNLVSLPHDIQLNSVCGNYIKVVKEGVEHTHTYKTLERALILQDFSTVPLFLVSSLWKNWCNQMHWLHELPGPWITVSSRAHIKFTMSGTCLLEWACKIRDNKVH